MKEFLQSILKGWMHHRDKCARTQTIWKAWKRYSKSSFTFFLSYKKMYNIINKVCFLTAVGILLSRNSAQDARSSPVSPNAFLIREFSLLLRDETRGPLTCSPLSNYQFFITVVEVRTLSMRTILLTKFYVRHVVLLTTGTML